MYSGASATLAFLSAWAAVACHHFVKSQKRNILLQILVTVLTVIVISIITVTVIRGRILLTLMPILPLGIMCIEFASIRKRENLMMLPLISALYFVFSFIPLGRFSHIAHLMWDDKGDRGNVGYMDEIPLFEIHMLFVVVCLILAVNLWIRMRKEGVKVIRISAISSSIFLVSIGWAFFWTIPRGNNDFDFLWFFFIIPGFSTAWLILCCNCIIAFTKCRRPRYTPGMNTSSLPQSRNST